MKDKQISDSFRLGAVLAVSGGLMDAYSYICRGKVFANAQTGNILLLGVGISTGNLNSILHYGTPILAFTLGIIISEIIRYFAKKSDDRSKLFLLHWRQVALLFELVCLTSVAFMPQSLNLVANSLISLACGIQVQSFRTLHGNGYATTMCIGNLRSATENLSKGIMLKDKAHLKKSLLYFGIITFFVLGAVIGNILIMNFGEISILASSFIITIAFLMMFSSKFESNESK